MQGNEVVTHIVHDRADPEHQRTIGYRIVEGDAKHVKVVCAETRLHPNDNFEKSTARGHINSRLKSYQDGGRSPRLRAFEADVAMPVPSNAQEYRDLEGTLLLLADIRLPVPAALRDE